MTTKKLLEMAAKQAGVMLDLEVATPGGVALVGPLSKRDEKALQHSAAEGLAVALNERYPAKVEKAEDGKTVKITSSLLVFTPQTLVEFIDSMLVAAFIEDSDSVAGSETLQ